MSSRLKIVLVVLAGAIVAVCAVGWYWFHNPDRFLPGAIANAERKTGLQIEVKHVEVRFLPLSVRVYGLEVKNPKPFPSGDFLNVPVLEATVEWMPLLHRKIVIRSLVLHQPTIDFISDPDGLWNFQNPAGPKNQPERFSMGSISTLQVKNGVLLGSNLIDPTDKPGPIILELQGLSGDLKQIEFHPAGYPGSLKAIQGSLTATKAGFGSIHTTDLRSQVNILPLKLIFKNFETKTYRGKANGDLIFNFQSKNTTFKTKLQVSGIGMPYLLAEFENGPPKISGMMQGNLSAAGAIEHTAAPLAGIYGSGNITVGKGELPGMNQNPSMKEIERFRTAGAAKLPPAAFSTFGGDMELKNHRMYSKRISIDFYGIDVSGTGSMSLTGGQIDYRGSATIEKKQGLLMKTFARWFKGAKEKEGRLIFPIRLTGTLANPQFSVVH